VLCRGGSASRRFLRVSAYLPRAGPVHVPAATPLPRHRSCTALVALALPGFPPPSITHERAGVDFLLFTSPPHQPLQMATVGMCFMPAASFCVLTWSRVTAGERRLPVCRTPPLQYPLALRRCAPPTSIFARVLYACLTIFCMNLFLTLRHFLRRDSVARHPRDCARIGSGGSPGGGWHGCDGACEGQRRPRAV